MANSYTDKHIQSILDSDTHLRCESTYFRNGNVSLLVTHFWNDTVETGRNMIFVPGWASTAFTWRYFLPRLTQHTSVYYFETREKSSSLLTNKVSFKVDDMADDIINYLHTAHKNSDFVLAGASTGATLILECWNSLICKPKCVVLLLPNRMIPIPRHISVLKILPKSFLPYIKPVAAHFMRNFRLTPKEVGQQASLFAALDAADMTKLRESGLALRKYKLSMNNGRLVDRPSLVIGASRDRFHKAVDVLDIRKSISGSDYIDLTSFTNAHGSKAAELVGRWVEEHYG